MKLIPKVNTISIIVSIILILLAVLGRNESSDNIVQIAYLLLVFSFILTVYKEFTLKKKNEK